MVWSTGSSINHKIRGYLFKAMKNDVGTRECDHRQFNIMMNNKNLYLNQLPSFNFENEGCVAVCINSFLYSTLSRSLNTLVHHFLTRASSLTCVPSLLDLLLDGYLFRVGHSHNSG